MVKTRRYDHIMEDESFALSFDNTTENISENNLLYDKTIGIFIVDFRVYYRYGFEFSLYGYFMPVWTLLNIALYTTMICVFVKCNLTSKTHLCIIALAISDSIAPICPSFFWFYFFTVKEEFRYVPFEWCRAFHYLTEIIPSLFTYSSFFLTIVLAIQRYTVIAFPFKVDKLCSRKIMNICIILCFVVSISIRAIHFFHYSYVQHTIHRTENKNTSEEICAFGDPEWLDITFSKYAAILQTTHTIIVNVIPCTLLVIIECLMLRAVHKNSISRKRMVRSSTGLSKLQENEKRLTYTTISITGVLLLHKIPTICIQIIDILRSMFGIQLITNYFDLWTTTVVLNIFYWMCTPSNFLITCCLSGEFRKGLKGLFRRSENRAPIQNFSSLSSGTASSHM